MSRKRTLYVSELLKRSKYYNIEVTIKTKTAYHYYPNIESALKNSNHLDEQVIYWKVIDKEIKYQLFISIFE